MLPLHVKCNIPIITLEKDNHSRPYVDNLCLFRCLGLHLCHDPNTLYAKYTDQPVETFEGVTMDELHKVETLFEETHLSLIRDIKAYIHSYRCSKCQHSLWKYPAWLERHELTCEAGVSHVYSVGVYHTTTSVFQRLDDKGITVVVTLRFYPYRATFHFACFFDENNLPTDSDRVQWIAPQVP